jgi:type IV pilus assembly protein PilO
VEEKLNQLGMDKAIMIGLVLTVIFYFLIYNDGSALEANLAAGRAALEQKTRELESMRKTLADAKTHQEVAARLGKDMEQVLSAVPQDYNNIELMKLVSTEAKSVGLNILSLAGGEGQASDPGKNFVPINVSVSLSGTFNQIMMFLSNLTKVGKVILTRDLNLTAGNSTATSPIMTFSATLIAYRYTEKVGGK